MSSTCGAEATLTDARVGIRKIVVCCRRERKRAFWPRSLQISCLYALFTCNAPKHHNPHSHSIFIRAPATAVGNGR